MEKVNLIYFLSLLVMVISVISKFFGPFKLPSLFDGGSLPYRSIIIGVATRLERQEQRRLVRKTWKQLVPDDFVEFRFFSADTPCYVDPYWRIRDSSCSSLNVFVPPNLNERIPIRLFRVQPTLINPGPAADGIGFKIKFPINIVQLGVSKKFLRHWFHSLPKNLVKDKLNRHEYRNLTVEIYDPIKDDVLVSANFSRVELLNAQADDGFVYVPVREDTYARNFIGILRIINHNQDLSNHSLSCNLVLNRVFGEDGLFSFDSLWVNQTSLPYIQQSCPLATFVYHIPDIFELRQVVHSKDTQNKCQENMNKNLQGKIVEEMEDFDDVVYVPDVVDTDENLPIAMLQFFQWALKNFDFDYLVISNDETFVAADQIYQKVQGSMMSYKGWLSNFRKFVNVIRVGDYYEQYYKSMQYPIMPSSSGSVLSVELVKYLSQNADRFIPFRTLSASLAVWLAPINPDIHQDNAWSIDNTTCSKQTLVFGPLYHEGEMETIFNNYKTCSRICSC